MNCAKVRDLLPEHALGVAGGDAAAIDRHLAGCAACRKEARELHGAAASLAFALAPAVPPAALEDEVVAAVHAKAGRTRRPSGVRRSTAAMLAAALALVGLVGGAAIARRDSTDARTAAEIRLAQQSDAFQTFVDEALQGEGTVASIGVLRPGAGRQGGGSAVSVVAPRAIDSVLVVGSGLDGEGMPYRVELADGQGDFARIGTVRTLDSGGGFSTGGVTGRDLTRFVNVLVRDRDGEVILIGTLRDEVPSPSPTGPTPSG
ncbi:MAG TPA: zf-HC2 domain-containing protein [Actinomycetota bacterium]|nr:zf-HC2 domain-containing protein [Actinomycetota bacterium]